MHLSLQHLWSWVDWNSLLMLRTKSEWRIRMLDKAPRQNISPQHLQKSFQVRFKALVVILHNFCSPWSHLSRTAQHPVFVFAVFVFVVRVELGGDNYGLQNKQKGLAMVNWWWCTDVHRLTCKTLKSKVTIQTWTMSMTTKPIMVANSWRSPPTSFSLSLWSTWELSVKWIQVNFIYTVLIATTAPPPAINTHKSGPKWPRGCPKKVLFRNWWLRTNGL